MKKSFSKEEIKEILQKAGQYDRQICESLGLRFYDWGVKCACPVHNGDNPAGFSYCPQRKVWSCWTHGCHEKHKNSLIGLVRAVKGCSFGEAINYIKQIMADPTVHPSDLREPEEYQDIIYPTEWLNDLDFNVSDWTKIGFTPAILAKFRVFKCMTRGKKMYGRIVVPFFNIQNEIVAFLGYRTNSIASDIKWKIQPKGFRKGNHLFGLNFVPPNAKSIILVEGPKDVIKLHQVGATNTTGLGGVSISTEQIRLLKSRNVESLYILLDSDEAGITGSEKIHKKLSLSFTNVYNISGKLSQDPGKTLDAELKNFIRQNIR